MIVDLLESLDAGTALLKNGAICPTRNTSQVLFYLITAGSSWQIHFGTSQWPNYSTSSGGTDEKLERSDEILEESNGI